MARLAAARLVAGLVEPHFRLLQPDLDDAALRRQADAWLDEARSGRADFDDRFVVLEEGRVEASAALRPADRGVYYCQVAFAGPGSASEALSALLPELLLRLRELGARRVHIRVPTGHGTSALEPLGFARLSERVEYRTPVARLPYDAGSPLRWRAMADKSDGALKAAADLLRRASEGDPDADPDEDALESLRSYLADPLLNGGADCVHIGEVDGRDAAIVVAQVNPSTGWSRITYMGVAPERRGRGFGRWAHRHGFGMLRAQGGTLYVAGTLVDNRPMLALFAEHGCLEHRRVEEFSLRLDAGPR